MSRPRLETCVGAIRMKNPVMVASGTFGYGPEYDGVVDMGRLGAIVVKGISLEPWEGNPPPRLVEVTGGLVNAIGLQNPGVDGFVREYMPFLRQKGVPVIVNIWGRSVEEYAEVAARFDGVAGVAGLELNISCPNIKEGGIAFGTDPGAAARVISAARKATKLTLIPKLSPNVPDIALFAKIAEDAGADAVSLINSIPAMVIDIETRRPALANTTGGLTGPAVHPVAVRLVWQAAKAVKIPVIGMGGISGAREAIEFMLAGASAVAVGTANFTDPSVTAAVIDGIEEYLVRKGVGDVRDIIGAVRA
ncbi:MAG: dihydroorotate dehydrogenase [bacterium]